MKDHSRRSEEQLHCRKEETPSFKLLVSVSGMALCLHLIAFFNFCLVLIPVFSIHRIEDELFSGADGIIIDPAFSRVAKNIYD